MPASGRSHCAGAQRAAGVRRRRALARAVGLLRRGGPVSAAAAAQGRGTKLGFPVTVTLRVNPIACVGYGMCAELLPELIELDPWGYPIVSATEVPRPLAAYARRAAQACPTLALLIDEASGPRR